MTEAGPLVQLRISLSRMPLRIAPAWSVLAGALAAASIPGDPGLWLQVVAAIILGDLAWGVLRQYAQAHGTATEAEGALALPLPYSRPDAPLSRWLGGLTSGGATWHGAAAGVILALGGGLLLGWQAFALSLVAIVVTAIAGPLARRGDLPAAAYALLDVLLPWTLGMVAGGWTAGDESSLAPLLVAAALTALQWGVLRASASPVQGGRFALFVGAGALIVVLVALSMPGAAALAAVLLAPPLYWLGQTRGREVDLASRLTRPGPWLMLTLFVVAFAVR